MNSISLATKGMIDPVGNGSTVINGGGGVIHMYRDRVNPKITVSSFQIKDNKKITDDNFKIINSRFIMDEDGE